MNIVNRVCVIISFYNTRRSERTPSNTSMSELREVARAKINRPARVLSIAQYELSCYCTQIAFQRFEKNPESESEPPGENP